MIFLVVLCSFATSRRRAISRERKTGRATSEDFTRFIYSSLQTALPIYLKGCGVGLAADGVLVFINETDGGVPALEYTLVAKPNPSTEYDVAVRAAIRRGAEMLALPP